MTSGVQHLNDTPSRVGRKPEQNGMDATEVRYTLPYREETFTVPIAMLFSTIHPPV